MIAVMVMAFLLSTIQKVFFYNDEPDRCLLSKGSEVIVFGVDGTMIPILDEPDFETMKRDGYIATPQPIEFPAVHAIRS
jgi:hypothetical protein